MQLASKTQLQHALKEWAIAVEALTAGETIILLRKGGIRERDFQVEHSPAWLYPTYEHQKPYLLKSKYASKVKPVESGWHPQAVNIKGCGEITDILPIDSTEQVEAMQPYHIWNEQMVSDRLKWKPQKPLIVLFLRVYRLPQPKIIPYNNIYGGCKSWIDLVQPLATEGLTPVLETEQYAQQVKTIKNAIDFMPI